MSASTSAADEEGNNVDKEEEGDDGYGIKENTTINQDGGGIGKYVEQECIHAGVEGYNFKDDVKDEVKDKDEDGVVHVVTVVQKQTTINRAGMLSKRCHHRRM